MLKKICMCLFIIVILGVIIYFTLKLLPKEESIDMEEFSEYTPQEEISEEQSRNTIITLYYRNINTKEIMPEAQMIDVKLLMENPCKTIMDLLLEGPKTDKLEAIIPQSARLQAVTTMQNIATVELNINDADTLSEEEISAIETSITKTLQELIEIEQVKVLINSDN